MLRWGVLTRSIVAGLLLISYKELRTEVASGSVTNSATPGRCKPYTATIMDTLIAGVLIYAFFSAAFAFIMLYNLRSARAAGGDGFRKILPYLGVDALFTALFVIWLIGRL